MKFCDKEIFLHISQVGLNLGNCNCQCVARVSTQRGQCIVETKPQEFGVASFFKKYPCKNVYMVLLHYTCTACTASPTFSESLVMQTTVGCSLTSHTFRRERKGLVTLQLPSCRRGAQLSNIVAN